jgi:hypothetical protein
MRRLPALCIALSLFAAATVGTGCGEGGAASGATVSVYVAAPLCQDARRELQKAGGEAGNLEVRAVCLPAVESGRTADLAGAGRNARRATEDTTAVAYLESPGRAAGFTQSVIESADIAWLETNSGSAAMRHVLAALEEAGSSSPRKAVLDQVG